MILAAVAVGLFAGAAGATEYDIDPAHTQVGFKARHVVGKVPGRFTKFSGSFTYDKKNPKAWKAEATIDAASINTDVEARDKHLKSDAFFDVEKCPTIVFKSTKVAAVKGDHFKLLGDLTMHCVTKPVALDVEVDGTGKDPWGNESASFSATATVNRQDWGISWNKSLDSGGVLVGDKIELSLEVTGNAKKADAPAKK
ncbi:MAG: polyisoprenoid-binding protein [Elusimicrobia bacterium]|nr:polyisoprenoid-binding protein [Elusimicrobiota bacterium]MDE2510467.1 polyisoprenoid-binding protein [Elusimicrobiota bacterium]